MLVSTDPKTITCAICGKTAERTGKRQKYCPDCSKKEASERGMLRWQNRDQTAFSGPVKVDVKEKCSSCKYWDKSCACCQFFLETGHMRRRENGVCLEFKRGGKRGRKQVP